MKQQEWIRVLVIDDSAYTRRTLTRLLESSPLVKVIGVARDGEEALRKVWELEPDLITLDLEMPRMDGFTFLRLVMAKRPTPVMVISGRRGDQDVFKALDLGAVDFIAKPTGRATPELESIQQDLIRKVHSVRHLRIDKVRERISAPPSVVSSAKPEVRTSPSLVAIGASTGGPATVMQILGSFTEAPQCAFVLSQHMPRTFTGSFADRLDRLTVLRACEARDGMVPEPGALLVAPGGAHLEFDSIGGRIVTRIIEKTDADKYAPSVDRMFASAAKHYGRGVVGIVLTGMGDDGKAGVKAVKESGGFVIAESEATAVIFGMPQQAIRTGAVDAVLPVGEIAAAIHAGVSRGAAPLAGNGGS